MHRWLSVAVAFLCVGLMGADAPPVLSQSVTVLNSTDVNGGLSVLQVAYVTAKVADLLDQRGIVINRISVRPPSLEKSGGYLCSDAKTALLLAPSILSSQTGRDEGSAAWNTVRIQLAVYDCATTAIRRITSGPNSGFDWTGDADRSVADAVKRYLSGR